MTQWYPKWPIDFEGWHADPYIEKFHGLGILM
jgi:hypothetical protein